MRVEEFLEQITIAVDLSKRIVLIIESLEISGIVRPAF